MTNAELNRDIKRLSKIENIDSDKEEEFKTEFKRLYYADRDFTAMNKESIRMMIRLNLRYRIIAFHHFGLDINLPHEVRY